MAPRKASLIKVKVTMVCRRPQNSSAGGLCSSVAYALWRMCLLGQCLEDVERAVSNGEPC